MWVLVFIYLYDDIPYVEKYAKYRFMNECFQAREALSEEVGKGNGYFKPGQQAVCIKY